MDSPPKSTIPSATPSHYGSRKSLRSTRSGRSTRSSRSTQSMRVFYHSHPSYHTCFGCLHVKIASCSIGFVVLIGVCLSLVYCVFTSQEQRRPNLKLHALPMIAVIVSLLYMFIGILQEKAKMLYPFIVLQIVAMFATAVSMIIVLIAIMCNTKYILRLIVNIDTSELEYKHSSLVILTGLGCQLILHTWGLRAVCGCFRYFTDLKKFQIRQVQINYV